MHRPSVVRAGALVVGAIGVAGMIVSSVHGSTNGALGFGLLCVSGALVLFTLGVLRPPAREVDRLRGDEIERLIGELTTSGAHEPTVRQLVRLVRSTAAIGVPPTEGPRGSPE